MELVDGHGLLSFGYGSPCFSVEGCSLSPTVSEMADGGGIFSICLNGTGDCVVAGYRCNCIRFHFRTIR
jgi:hypothetical protein